MSDAQINQPLPSGFQLDAYRIDRMLSSGGFSIVYRAFDGAGQVVAIKEYLPARFARRNASDPVPEVLPEHLLSFNRGMKSFFEEGRVLSGLNHVNVVQVLNFFRANQTAYMVMRYEEGRSLQECVNTLKEKGISLEEMVLRNVFVRLLNGLREVHKRKLLHLDIKPANIYLRIDNNPVLLDFGATRLGLGGRDDSLVNVLTPGYAAPEQLQSAAALGPWTDIYSIGATLYSCLSGEVPLSAKQRLIKDEMLSAQQLWSRQYSPQLLELIDWCLKLSVDQRPQSVFELQKVLNGDLLDLVDASWFET